MTATMRAPADLDRMLEEILRESPDMLLDVDPRRIVNLTQSCDGGPIWTGTPLAVAEGELVRVHRSELAFLLREAARRCEHWSAAEAAAWRGLVEEALCVARADGLELAASVPTLPALPPQSAPFAPVAPVVGAVELARASLLLFEHPLGSLELGLALRRRGQPLVASGVLAAALHGLARLPGVLQARPWPDLICGLASAQERAGHPRRARLLRRWLPERVA